MKELSNREVEMVNGAGIGSDFGSQIGNLFGSIGEQFGLSGATKFGKEAGQFFGSLADKFASAFGFGSSDKSGK